MSTFSAQELVKWSGAIFFALLQAYILYGIAIKWDMSKLICAEDGAASMSRFQLLLFTFAIAGGYFYLLMERRSFPDVNTGVIALLGLSTGTYAISKGIQASRDSGQPAAPPTQPAPPAQAAAAAAGAGGAPPAKV